MKRKIIKYAIIATTTLVTVMSFINVFGDNTLLIKRAELAICGTDTHCKYAKSKLVRTPFSQTLTFVSGQQSTDVVCRRPWIWFGTYRCVVER